MKILNTQNSSTNTIKALIYGASGVGKTTLAGTLSRPTLIISAESGLLSLRGKKIDVVDITTDDEGKAIPSKQRLQRLFEVYEWLLTEEARTKYEVIYIDSITEINLCLLESIEDNLTKKFNEAKNQSDGQKVDGKKEPTTIDKRALYGELLNKMRGLTVKFRDLQDYSVIFTALDTVDKDENGARYQNIAMAGSFSERMPGYLDEVFYLVVNREGERVLVTNKTDRFIAKDRSGKLEKYEEPNLDVIFDKILGERKKVEEKK